MGVAESVISRTVPVSRVNVLGVGVSAVTLDEAVGLIESWITERSRRYVCVCTAHGVTEALRDPSYRDVLNRAGLVTPDGMPLVWLARRAGHRHVSRVYGPDLLLAVCARSAGRGWRHYFCGGAPGVAALLVDRLQRRYPGLQVAGVESPPFRPLTPEEEDAMVGRLNAARPDIVWVGLGAPRQDLWMARYRDRLEAPVLVGVGAAFDFHAGVKPQAPRWMRERGLEWLFRLACEPRRLWRRYLLGGPVFLGHVFLQQARLRRYG
jgi:N-acetylglucosaminyldiphosphoundecaprenol N-acetyl-beta-D-mannosaminyltransferase